jgi:hypothetical protein
VHGGRALLLHACSISVFGMWLKVEVELLQMEIWRVMKNVTCKCRHRACRLQNMPSIEWQMHQDSDSLHCALFDLALAPPDPVQAGYALTQVSLISASCVFTTLRLRGTQQSRPPLTHSLHVQSKEPLHPRSVHSLLYPSGGRAPAAFALAPTAP